MMQIYVDDNGDKVGVVEKEEHIKFVDAVDFDSVFDFSYSFDFSDFSIFQCLRQSGEVLTLYKKKANKVRPVSRPHEGGLRPGRKGNWHTEAISKEKYKLGGAYAGWIIPKFSDIKRGLRLTEERIKRLKVRGDLSAEEHEIFLEVLFNRKAGIAFDFTEKGHFLDDVEPPHVILTVSHTPWQAKSFKMPKALEQDVVKIIKDRIDCGVLERSFGSYRNLWFLVPKKTGKYYLINSAQRLNAVTIKDASLPLTVDKFSEEFTGYLLISLLDLFSGYDQCSLAPESRDMMAFMMPFRVMRMATLLQGYTNGVQVFDWVIRKVLQEQIAQGRVKPFIDDVGVKPASKSFYRKRKQASCRTEEGDGDGEFEEVMLGVRKYVMEAIVS